jgi:hypothetical protein
LGVVDEERRLGVGALGPEQHVQDPLVRIDGAALAGDALLAADHQQGVAGHGIQGLDAPPFQHRGAAEHFQVEAPGRARRQGGGQHGGQGEQPWQPGEQLGKFHRASRTA